MQIQNKRYAGIQINTKLGPVTPDAEGKLDVPEAQARMLIELSGFAATEKTPRTLGPATAAQAAATAPSTPTADRKVSPPAPRGTGAPAAAPAAPAAPPAPPAAPSPATAPTQPAPATEGGEDAEGDDDLSDLEGDHSAEGAEERATEVAALRTKADALALAELHGVKGLTEEMKLADMKAKLNEAFGIKSA